MEELTPERKVNMITEKLQEGQRRVRHNEAVHGWLVNNGSGWNNHSTARVLQDMVVTQEELPQPPPGYAVLVAPVSDKPLGLRCALVRVLPQNEEVVGGSWCNDGCAEEDKASAWASREFKLDAEIVSKCGEESADSDASAFFIKRMTQAIAQVGK